MPSSPWLDRTAYPFRSQYAALSAGRVHYVDEGPTPSSPDAGPAGCPVLLVHGTPSWSFEYRHLIRSLSATRRVIAFDHLRVPAHRDHRFRGIVITQNGTS
ncbi:MAG: hypothetical protein ABUL62_32260 [Myxococcales bacterium]